MPEPDYEQMLAEEYRHTFRFFRDSMGLSEAGAYQATIGRDGAGAVSGPRLQVEERADRYERMGMTRAAAEHAAAGREFSSFEEARRVEATEALRRLEEAKPKPKARTKAGTKAKPKAPDLAQLVETAVAKALADRGTGTTRAELTEKARRLVEADIADIEAGLRPSDRLHRS